MVRVFLRDGQVVEFATGTNADVGVAGELNVRSVRPTRTTTFAPGVWYAVEQDS